ncbi:hypothetical protein UFOVP1299_27 [uncultured Caudovirales phage]|uniref:ASCH domain containing protein n=1 Tax=uncultured Caudovirales phage TaxID=2100421 RepID=A0A6J5RHV7_9CAUD|nr:hypothetical protein UFOVP1299_27 [uncultured Caudovirales phage]
MTDRPIIFNEPMIRALAKGKKTQTRILVRHHLSKAVVGDRLWVRETWANFEGGRDELSFRATSTGAFLDWVEGEELRWIPSVHMPRWASRFTLEITDVSSEGVQDIDEHEAIMEGVVANTDWIDPRAKFASIWNSIYTVRGERWGDNPRVTVLTFKVVPGNIDAITKGEAQ